MRIGGEQDRDNVSNHDLDLSLIQAIAHGDTSALEKFVRRYQPRLTRFLFRYLGDGPATEDLVQETLLRVWGHSPHFEPQARVSTWVFSIAYRLALNELKRRNRFQRFIGHCADLLTWAIPQTPPDQILEKERMRLIQREMERLPERQRAALLLRVEEDLSYGQIAQVLETTVPGVESLIHRARQRLKLRLAER